jgi:hypothetical protein
LTRLAGAALVVLPLAVAACGGGSKQSSNAEKLSPGAYLSLAGKKTAKTTSEHLTLKGTTAVSGQSVTVSGQGDFDNTARIGAFHLDFNAGGFATTVDEVVGKNRIYLRSPLLEGTLPTGKTWVLIDLRRALSARGIDVSTLSAQDPTQALAQLQRLGTVTKVGSDTIDGTPTTHYVGHIDPSKLPQHKQIKALANARYGPFDVWVGNDDLVRRLKFSFTVAPAGTASKQTVTVTSDFSDFGKIVKAEVPPAASTFDATQTSIKGLGG